MHAFAARLSALLLALFACADFACAKYVDISTEDLVGEADVGVIGRPTHISRYFDGYHEGQGRATLEVSKWLFGDVPHTATLPVEWRFNPLVVGSGDIEDNSTDIWLLTVKDGHFMRPAHQFILPATTESAVLKATENLLRAKQVLGDGITTYVVRLTYRNLTTQTLTLPLVETSRTGLVLPESMNLKVFRYPTYLQLPGLDDEISSFAEKIRYTSSPLMIRLSPGHSYSMEFKPAEFYAISDEEGFTVRWCLAGFRESNPALMHNPLWPEGGGYYFDPDMPLWARLFIMSWYSPTREVLAALGVGVFAAAIYMLRRYRKRKRCREPG